MTSLPYIDSGNGTADHALLRVSNPRVSHNDIPFTKSLAKVCDTTLRAKDVPNSLADSEKLLFTSASELPPLPKLGKKSKTEFNTPPKALTGLHLERENNLAAELAAKRKLCSLRKALTRANSESALQAQLVQRHKDARKLRAEQDERSGSKFMKDLAKYLMPATSAECSELGIVLLEAFSIVEPDPRCRGWYKLFKHMDIDGDGRIAYYELENLIREQLRISSFKLPDEKIQAVWLSVDTDRSGWWSSSEFGKMMRKAEDFLNNKNSGGTGKGATDSGNQTQALNASSSSSALPQIKKKGGRRSKNEEALSPEMEIARERAEFATRCALDEILESTGRIEAEAARIEKQVEKKLSARNHRMGGTLPLGSAGSGSSGALPPPPKSGGSGKGMPRSVSLPAIGGPKQQQRSMAGGGSPGGSLPQIA